MTLTDFILARLDEHRLPAPVEATYRRVLAIASSSASDGEDDDVLDWLFGADEEEKAVEYLLGADPASEGERLRRELLLALAGTWRAHPHFDARWETKSGA